jgi:hypothetical protein
MTFEAPLADDMKKLISLLRRGEPLDP